MSKNNEALTKPRLIKLHVDPDDHRQVRLAAVMQDVSVTEFCRAAAVAKAGEITQTLSIPGNLLKKKGTKK